MVYFKMLMVGFFENLSSERAIAARCEDGSGSGPFWAMVWKKVRRIAPVLSVIRGRLPGEGYQAAFELILKALKECGLLKGRHVGIDSSVIEANASLKSFVLRNTEEAYCHRNGRAVSPRRHASRSASTMMRTSASKRTFGSQPSCFLTLAGFPTSRSTSAGLS